MNKTIEIFDEIYKILEKNVLFIGRINSNKNRYANKDYIEIQKNFYYDSVKDQQKRLFNQKQFDILTKKWSVVVLKEDVTTRQRRKIYLGIYFAKVNDVCN